MATPNTKEEKELFEWQGQQGYIVSGGGKVVSCSSIYTHYYPNDLPHYLLEKRISRRVFNLWKASGRVSYSIIGCWSRPIFCGGWRESSLSDTDAYNLQTPSLFIDMRFPTKRPSNELRQRGSLKTCSERELRILSRQHCFSGYSLPEVRSNPSPLTFTRHHVIDWNYHQSFPRSRPNRWWVEIQEPSQESFKEHSTVRDENGVPVYFERWQRREPIPLQQHKYLALRKVRPCPDKLKQDGKIAHPDQMKDAIIIVVGNHFAVAIDRDYTKVRAHLQANSTDLLSKCNGGGGFFVDYLLNSNYEDRRDVIEDYLGLEGSYGKIVASRWMIEKSTHPWNEGNALFSNQDEFELSFDSKDTFQSIFWSCKNLHREISCTSSWEVVENSFTSSELSEMFPQKNPKLIARL